ncbi:ComF family protein [Lacticaseibacillus absianus]|uniref:ComF family protein n=1 Tax=Lacticaseibacillus absianus TaxID=2729623 RepID=UPI001FE70D51|nr:ComF family protein [Lacticaseibacillus absianus]
MICVMCARPLTTDFTLAALISRAPLRLPTLCVRCEAQFERIDPASACPGCGRQAHPALCGDCQRWAAQGQSLLQHRALFTYNEPMRQFIQLYKGQGDRRRHTAFQHLMPLARRGWALVPVTSEPHHFAARGFDPVLDLFSHLQLSRWLRKADTPLPQAQKDRAARLATPQSFIATLPARPAPHVLLLDDLYTTGRTLYHAQAALRAAGYGGTITSFSLIR